MAEFKFTWASLPLASVVSLLLCFIGLVIFSVQIHTGMLIARPHTIDLLGNVTDKYFRWGVQGVYVGSTCMTLLIMVMGAVGIIASRHIAEKRERIVSYEWVRLLGNEVACAVMVTINCILHMIWLVILTILTLMLAGYLGFDPMCEPNASHRRHHCLNFSKLHKIINGDNERTHVALSLCGMPMNHFCKLVLGVLDWFWPAYIGCLMVILGLSQFQSALSANYAHNRQHTLQKEEKVKKKRRSKIKKLNLSHKVNQSPFYSEGNEDDALVSIGMGPEIRKSSMKLYPPDDINVSPLPRASDDDRQYHSLQFKDPSLVDFVYGTKFTDCTSKIIHKLKPNLNPNYVKPKKRKSIPPLFRMDTMALNDNLEEAAKNSKLQVLEYKLEHGDRTSTSTII